MRIGQDAGQVIDNERAYRELTALNDIVNKQIASWSNGGMKSNVILDLGIPSDVLQKFGIPNLPIKLTQSVLVKATQRHKVAVSYLKDLALNIHAPLAIFASKHGTDHIVLVTEVRHRDGNIVAAIDLSVTRRNVIINDIRSVYPKQDENVSKWIEDGYLLGVEKRKGRDWLENSAGSNSQQDQAMAAFDNLTVYDTDHLRKPPEQKCREQIVCPVL